MYQKNVRDDSYQSNAQFEGPSSGVGVSPRDYPDVMTRNRRLNSPDVEFVIQTIQNPKNVFITISLTGKSVTDEELSAISEAIKNKDVLEGLVINLGSNQLTDAGIIALSGALREKPVAVRLELEANSISDLGAEALMSSLKHNILLSFLSLQNNKISNDGAYSIANFIANKDHAVLAEYLSLSNNLITDEGAIAIADAIREYPSLITLYLSNNLLTDASAEAFALALNNSHGLLALGLNGCKNISDIGIEQISDALRFNYGLRSLGVSGNNITDRGAQALAGMLKVNTALLGIGLSGTNIGDLGAGYIGDALKVNQVLKYLSLIDSQIGDSGAISIAEALEHNLGLQELYLFDNKIGNIGGQALVQGMTLHSVLTYLGLSENDITEASIFADIDELENRNRLNPTLPSFERNHISLREGQRIPITLGELDVTARNTDESIILNVENTTHGRFENNQNQTINQFSTRKVEQGDRVYFISDGASIEPGYWITATNGNYTTTPRRGVVFFEPVDDAPVVNKNDIVVEAGDDGVVINADQLDASDGESDPSNIMYIIIDVLGGMFANRLKKMVSNFTQADIDAENIQFISDGSGNASFVFNVTDGYHMSGPFSGNIHFGTMTSTSSMSTLSALRTKTQTYPSTLNPLTSTISSTITSSSLMNATTGTFTNLITRSTHTMWQGANSSSTSTTLAGSSSGTTTMGTTAGAENESVAPFMIVVVVGSVVGLVFLVGALCLLYRCYAGSRKTSDQELRREPVVNPAFNPPNNDPESDVTPSDGAAYHMNLESPPGTNTSSTDGDGPYYSDDRDRAMMQQPNQAGDDGDYAPVGNPSVHT